MASSIKCVNAARWLVSELAMGATIGWILFILAACRTVKQAQGGGLLEVWERLANSSESAQPAQLTVMQRWIPNSSFP